MNTGVIACLCPPAALAERLAALVPGGMPAEQLHLTLAYFGEAGTLDSALLERIRAVLMNAAKEQTAIVGSINGVCRLATPDGDALVAVVDLPLLPSFREELVEQFESVGASVSKQHGFLPHITLAFLEPSAPSPLVRLDPIPVTFGAIELWTADTHEWFPLRTTYSKPKGERTFGAQVELGAEVAADGGVWNVLAYEVELKSRKASLTRSMFEQCVSNFARYPKVPVCLEHADTDPSMPSEWAEPRGWITQLRVGSMQRNGRTVATLEGRMALDERTRNEVNTVPPKWPFGSVTIIPEAVDEETGSAIGALLWSFSLTAHPALADVPRLAASRSLEMENTPMKTFLTLAALIGIAATSEDDAHDKLASRAAEGTDVRKALNLSANAPINEVHAKLAALNTEAAKVPSLTKELELHRKAAVEREDAERKAWIDDVIAAQPELTPARASLELHAKHDFAGFKQAHPRPSFEELSQRAQDPQRFARVAGNGAAPAPNTGTLPAADVLAAARAIQEEARAQGYQMPFSEAIARLEGKE